jgi:signal peptidase I
VQEASYQPPPGWLRVLTIGRRPKATLVRVLVLIGGCGIVFGFCLVPIRIDGISMLPTYHTGQINFVNRLAYLRHEPRRGDLVSIRYAGRSVMLMKRIIALPGETIAFVNGRAHINGQPLAEPYVKLPCAWNTDPIPCGPDQYYVVGDNRSMAFELHTQGRADRERIIGKLLL